MRLSLVERLRATAARAPAAIAFIKDDRRVSYDALWTEVAQVADFLRSRELPAGARVALLMENSPRYAAAYYGVLAAGGVAVALNTAAKARDLTNWLQHCDARWLVADAGHAELAAVLASGAVTQVLVDGPEPRTGVPSQISLATWAAIAAREPGPPPVIAADDANAAIIYTSGTTGRPKGVTLSHKNLAANTDSILAYLALTAADRSLNVLPFYYSYGNSILHTHLAVGASIVLENSLMYPHAILEKMAAESATGFAGVPSTYALLLSRTRLEQYDLRTLRYVTQAGGAMAPAHIARLKAALPHVRIFVMYGQTEATARLTYLPPERLEEKLGAAGIAIPNVRLEIRDEHGHALPPGVVGEIYATGDNIMRGYWDDAAATAQALTAGWLKTGDLASMDAEGFVFIQGRRSDMIKTGAHRINPKEIEETIAEIDGVAEVAVVGIADELLGQAIKAIVVPRPDATLTALAVRAHCHKHLAAYKIPRHIEFVPSLPKTASGKVQRYLLTEATGAAGAQASAEEKLA